MTAVRPPTQSADHFNGILMDSAIAVPLPLLLMVSVGLMLFVLWVSRRAATARHGKPAPVASVAAVTARSDAGSTSDPHSAATTDACLLDVLRRVCALIESCDAESCCTIALYDSESQRAGRVAAGRLPPSFTRALEDRPAMIASQAASAARDEPVAAEDIATDPLWAEVRDLALSHELRSALSLPVMGVSGRIIAVLTIYWCRPRHPSSGDLQIARAAVALATSAIEQSRIGEALHESLTRLEVAQGMARLGFWERDLVRRRTVAFGEINRILGIEDGRAPTLDQLLNRVVAEDRSQLIAAYEEVTSNRPQLTTRQFRIREEDGSIRYMRAQRRAVHDESGRIIKVVGTVQDVTEQSEAALHLQAGEERFRLVAEHTGQLILDCHLAAGEVHCAGAVREILGEEVAAAPKLPLDGWRKVVHPDDLLLVQETIKRVLRGERPRTAFRILRMDGQVLDVEATGSAIRDAQGWATRIIATVSDISDRARAQAEGRRYLAQLAFLADAARKVNSVLSVAELLRIITDIARDLVDAHVAVSAIAPDENGLGGLRSGSASAKYAALEGDGIATALLGAETLPTDVELKPSRQPRAAMSDDEAIDVAAVLDSSGVLTVPLRTPAGRMDGLIRVADKREGDFNLNDERVLGQLADLAAVGIENARLYGELEARVGRRTRELEQSNRELEAFSYSVSHDLRGPLRAISGFTGLLRERHYEAFDADGRRYLERIESGTLRMSGLIDDLLELGRVNRLELKCERLNLSALVESAAHRLRERSPERAVNITIEPEHYVWGDLRLLEIALENLLDNAWKFTAGRPVTTIGFGMREVGDDRAFFVQDNGVGFDPRYASNLFGVFQRLHSMTDFPGSGVGLATVQRIVQRHGGRIWAEAEIDRGAAFYFTLAEEQQ